MEKCTYAWKEWDKENRTFIEKKCMEEIWESSDEFCIFHDPSLEKDVKLLQEKMEKKTDCDFRGYYFPEDLDFRNKKFDEKVYFSDVIFQKEVDFSGATFQDANFREVTFQGTGNFEGAIFQGTANFREATFKKDVDFSGATFRGNANFAFATFRGNATYPRVDFQGDIDFYGVTFQGYVDFSGTNFRKNGSFGETYFEKNADFSWSTFHGNTSFWKSKFQDTDFSLVTFQSVDFYGVTFKNVDFWRNIFNEKFELLSWEIEKLNISEAEFLSRSYITCNLTKALFDRCFLENVAFIDCTWSKNYVIYEEQHMNDEDINISYKKLETIYRNLKQNMHDHGDYTKAGKFYYREMECRKKTMRVKKFSVNWFKSFGYSILKYTCGYGEKPELAVRNSFLIILLGAVLFLFCGVARVGTEIPPEENPYIIDYSLDSLNFSHTTFKDFGYCLYYSVVTFTTLGYGDIHPLGCSHLFASVEALTGAFFMALFVVVFVRKMMR